MPLTGESAVYDKRFSSFIVDEGSDIVVARAWRRLVPFPGTAFKSDQLALTTGPRNMTVMVRAAAEADLSAILAIYNDAVANTTAIWNDGYADLDNRRQWFDARRKL